MIETFETKKDKTREIIKCGKDPGYFIKNYIKIQHPLKGRIKFDTYPFQDEVVENMNKHRFNICLKSRQLGLSTISAAYSLWYALFHRDKNVLVIATKLGVAVNFIKKVKVALNSLPPWLILPKFSENQTSVTFSNGSQIVATATSEDAGRSEALSLLIIDEAAFIRNFDDIWTGLSPTMSTGGSAFILSTPNGVGGMYYKLWVDAEAGQNSFNPIKLPWWVHPEHDEEWFKKETKNISKQAIAQEYLCDFSASGETFLNNDDLVWVKSLIKEPIEKSGYDRNVWIWEKPIQGARYVISADVSRGDAADFSTFHIVESERCIVVAEYMGKCPPEILAKLIDQFGRLYNNALAIPENNNHGYATCIALRDQLKYPSLFYEKNKGDPFKAAPPIINDWLPGFSTYKNSRLNALTKLEELIRNKMLISYSSRTSQQLSTFIWNGAKPQAMRDSHDDLIMSLAIAVWLVGGSFQANEEKEAVLMAMLASTSKQGRDLSSIPNNHMEVNPVNRPSMNGPTRNHSYNSRDNSRSGMMRDFSWLLK